MGTFKNKPWQNWVGWSTAAIMIGLTGAYIYTGLMGLNDAREPGALERTGIVRAPILREPYVPDLPFKTGAQIAFPLSGCAVLAFASETF